MSPSVQDEIKQSRPFPSRTAEAMVAVARTAAVLDHAWGETLRPFGITPTQYNVLRILRGSAANGLCGREVGERLISQVPDVSRLLERMEDLELITRERDHGDRRHVTARIASRGEHLLRAVEPELQALEKKHFARFTEDQLEQLIGLLDAIRNWR
jgi:DNA-binding MarR family transcriptional regulator